MYDYFYPGFRAGGPIQSLTHLAAALHKDYAIFVVTGSHDLLSKETYKNIIINDWNKVELPGNKGLINVYYADKALNKKVYLQIFNKIIPDIIYLNNIYSDLFFRLPLSVAKSGARQSKVVVCPRGMLQKGALAVKPFKKKIYLTYLQFAGRLKNVCWHATNEEEATDIRKYFPENKGIIIAPNIPKSPYAKISFLSKERDQLRLVFLSLITEKKNLSLLLALMQLTQKKITLDIYGPVTDNAYWESCEAQIKLMPEKVQYKGDVQPADVQQVLSQYHALILFTKGENFGHALYESLSVGRPVITSYFTPWNDLQQKKAGTNVNIYDIQDCLKKVSDFAEMDQNEYNAFCEGAYKLSLQYYEKLDANGKYQQLFSS